MDITDPGFADQLDQYTDQGAEFAEGLIDRVVAGEREATNLLRQFVSWVGSIGKDPADPVPAPPTGEDTGAAPTD